MNSKGIRRLLAVLALGVVLAPVALAEPPPDKAKSRGANAAPVKNDTVDGNSGQVTSECNQRANQKQLKGQDRKEYVEWCTDQGERYQYDDRRYDQDRTCYRKAEERGLSGEVRRVFVQECLRKQETSR